VTALPGIGRSTAGAILALSRGERHPILDGNAKRCLARVFGIEGDPSSASVLGRLCGGG
jgi:A/G-specific adenine glycosylase